MTQAKIIATAYKGDVPIKDHLDNVIQWIIESSTDLPFEYLGEAAGLCLQRAWKTGVDPARTEGFHLRLTFE